MTTILKNILAKRKITIPASIIVIGVIAVVLLVAVRSNRQAQAAPRPLDVEVVQVVQQDVPVYSEWIGTTQGMVNADIQAHVTGYLLRQDYKEGSFVKKGQLLFEIDPRPFQAALGTCVHQQLKTASSHTQRPGEFEGAINRSL